MEHQAQRSADDALTQSASEHVVYTRGEGQARLLFGVYVDDLVVTGACTTEIKKFKLEMCQRFKMSDLGFLTLYLGMEVSQEPCLITLKQTAFAQKLLEKEGMAECNRTSVPMEPRLKLTKDSSNPLVDITLSDATRHQLLCWHGEQIHGGSHH